MSYTNQQQMPAPSMTNAQYQQPHGMVVPNASNGFYSMAYPSTQIANQSNIPYSTVFVCLAPNAQQMCYNNQQQVMYPQMMMMPNQTQAPQQPTFTNEVQPKRVPKARTPPPPLVQTKPTQCGLYVKKKDDCASEPRSSCSTPAPSEPITACSTASTDGSRPSTPFSESFVHNPYCLPTIIDDSASLQSESTDILDVSTTTGDSEGARKRRRKKKQPVEDNKACDAIRYKTKMCKNWETNNKCPYGPRCLFAHGKKELRVESDNNSAIITAARSGSPERQFFEVGHFPSFIPIPHELLNLVRTTNPGDLSRNFMDTTHA